MVVPRFTQIPVKNDVRHPETRPLCQLNDDLLQKALEFLLYLWLKMRGKLAMILSYMSDGLVDVESDLFIFQLSQPLEDLPVFLQDVVVLLHVKHHD
ncbi:hypothetical protein NDU88_002379 [Pleurodeles waltl]|uniref:Uncharacterized protein n=1 Tax=Pleurodeles waltl TaxID=8319 RepID=A0AAV7RCK0_PLEWA|nr:hypothetical protein NDU88_002379 [Pleurodeles waltl]